MISLSIIAICLTINVGFLILLAIATKLGWLSPVITKMLLDQFTGVVTTLVTHQVSAKAAVLSADLDAKAVALHHEIDTKIETKSASLDAKMEAKMAAIAVRRLDKPFPRAL